MSNFKMDNRLNNILNFTIIFLSGDLNPLYQSPDYILEKFFFYFGDEIVVKEHDECDLFKKYKRIWEDDDYRINSIFLFLTNVFNYRVFNDDEEDPFNEENWGDLISSDSEFSYMKHIARMPQDYFILFNKWIGDVNDIPDVKKDGLHKVLKMKIYNIYKEILGI